MYVLDRNEESVKEDTMEKNSVNASVTTTTRPLAHSEESYAQKAFALPSEKGAHCHMWLRYYFFTMYRRLFSLVFIGNLVAILTFFACRRTLANLHLPDLAIATASNITVSLLMRQENVVNFLFTIACSIPIWMPLGIRRNCAKIFHIGGIHSSAGVAAVFWFVIFTVAATISLAAPQRTSLGETNPAIVLVAYLISLLFISILITAHPTFRRTHHDIFERTHRFAGWTILILFWILTILSASASRTPHLTLSKALVKDPTLYLLLISTISVILPWLHLRRVPVRPEILSSHAIRLHFSYTNTYPGTTVRISSHPLTEWHAFATVAKPGVAGFSLVVSNAGDWTQRQIDRGGPDRDRLWVRGIPVCGVLRIVPLFRRIVLVATGSGIGPCLPILMAKRVPLGVLWSAPDPEGTFGREIVEAVRAADAEAVVWDTRTRGRPNLVREAWSLVEACRRRGGGGGDVGKGKVKYDVEAVCVVANKKVTEMVVRGMESRGMAAYGPLFDS